jgi:starch synthase (maltosyl-transferring)
MIGYAKRTGDNVVITIVNVDTQHAQAGAAIVPAHLGLPPAFLVEDQLTGERYDWRIGPNYVSLDPPFRMAHILKVV